MLVSSPVTYNRELGTGQTIRDFSDGLCAKLHMNNKIYKIFQRQSDLLWMLTRGASLVNFQDKWQHFAILVQFFIKCSSFPINDEVMQYQK